MLVEPPRPHVPARAGLTIAPSSLLRAAVSAAALALALLSRGDAVVLAVLLGAAAWHLPSAGAVLAALVASSWRWGSTSLEALAGDQAVLGAAGLVGPGRAAASAWVAALAVVLASPATRWRRLRIEALRGGAAAERPLLDVGVATSAAASGAVSAAIVAGPSLGGDWWLRALATVVAAAAALAVGRLRHEHRRAIDVAALLAGLVAVVLAAGDAPTWWGTVDRAALHTGIALGGAVASIAVVGGLAVVAMGHRRA